jgi:Mg/Co/Ni transporter MgtE
MLKVNDEKILKEISGLKAQLSDLAEKAKANADKLTDIPDDFKDKIRQELLAEYGREPQDKLDYLMTFVDEEAEPQPTE